ncbi:MAG: GNAT family N-acetyltransferase [Flavobacteriaceae bacterium]
MIVKPKIRLATFKDLAMIVKIYNQAINSKNTTGDLQEFTLNKRIDWFQKFSPCEYPIFVAELKNKIVGYATLSPYRLGRKAMERIAEISFYIDYEHHNLGIGSALIQHCIDDCPRIGKESLLAILLDINTSSIQLLKKFGFDEWGHFPDIIHLENQNCGQLIYGLKVEN